MGVGVVQGRQPDFAGTRFPLDPADEVVADVAVGGRHMARGRAKRRRGRTAVAVRAATEHDAGAADRAPGGFAATETWRRATLRHTSTQAESHIEGKKQ